MTQVIATQSNNMALAAEGYGDVLDGASELDCEQYFDLAPKPAEFEEVSLFSCSNFRVKSYFLFLMCSQSTALMEKFVAKHMATGTPIVLVTSGGTTVIMTC